MNSKRKLDTQKKRDVILATRLPSIIETNIKGRSRVAVRTVRDLEVYVSFIEEICQIHHKFYGHKKVKSKFTVNII